MKRRKFIIGAGTAALGGSALIGTGAFSSVESQRDVSIEVATDENAYLGMKPLNTPNSNNYVELDGNGHLAIDIAEHDDFDGPDTQPGEGVNSDSHTYFDGMFELCNQGKEGACLSYSLPNGVVQNAVDDQTVSFYYVERNSDGEVTNRRIVQEGEELLLELGECTEMGVRTVTAGVGADDTPLIDDEVVVTADVDGDCFVQGTPECPDCTTPDAGTDDFDVAIESIDDGGFPTVEVTTRVDTTAGGNGDLGLSNFGLCEETVDGLGDGFCGQTIQSVRFGGEQEETLADIMFVLDTSGSMGGSKIASARDGAIQLVGGDTDRTNDANAGGFDPTVNAGLVEYDFGATLVSPLGTDQNQLEDDIAGLTAGGGTDLGSGISTATTELQNSPNNRANAPDFMIVLGNGDTSGGSGPADTAKNNGTTIFGIAYGSGASVSDFEEIAGEVPSDPDYQDYTFDADQDDITAIFNQIGEEIFGTYTLEYETANFATDGTDRNVRVYVDDPNEGDADITGSYTSPSS